jgi:uncharacterized protein YidB (DUF937 family)
MSPLNMALMGLLAYRTFEGKGRLADMLGRGPGGAGAPSSAPATPSTGGGLGGMLGGLLGGGAAGGILSGGLGDLLQQFQQNGQGDKAQSWIAAGPNKPASPSEIEQALGPEGAASKSFMTKCSKTPASRRRLTRTGNRSLEPQKRAS